ncbi:hypothetical protein COCCADRAFT_40388 [Bipolaris zeicola 26-R-13]|uniref:DUF4598 domain-containing protein n=1 Tax=Cochliobolus carbonum (strain 26-R-13) TaxID=930089 RepID=W6XU42_COCC2|nr:uncharacterized protein COCCADRAFT_40388 [Bipolaris zeicola 26-R-13]EUC29203.1 hypothetical protein COCCADRAFT_40388 [Bipolaris zeicola 26-R-13]
MAQYTHDSVPHRTKPSSSPSMSSQSALASTNATDGTATNASDYGTSDTDSTLSESSEEPSSDESSSEEEDDEDDDGEDTQMELDEAKGADGVVNLRANRGTKPIMKLTKAEMGPDIRGFLKDFLPRLKAANEELEAQKRAGTLRRLDAEDQEEGEPYIEMDLGLGVLEEKDPNAAESDTEDTSDADEEDGNKEKDVLGKLLGRREKPDPAKIEVLPNTTGS